MTIAEKKEQVKSDDFFKRCCFKDCISAPEWHYPYNYGRRLIIELFVPACHTHHKIIVHGMRIKEVTDYFKWVALSRADLSFLKIKYPKFKWGFELKRLQDAFGIYKEKKHVTIVSCLRLFDAWINDSFSFGICRR